MKHRHCRGRSDRLKSNFLFPLFHVPFQLFQIISTPQLNFLQILRQLNSKISNYSVASFWQFLNRPPQRALVSSTFKLNNSFPFDCNLKDRGYLFIFLAILWTLKFCCWLNTQKTEAISKPTVRFRRIATHAVSISAGNISSGPPHIRNFKKNSKLLFIKKRSRRPLRSRQMFLLFQISKKNFNKFPN